MRREKGNSNGHNSSFGRPLDAIFVLNLRVFRYLRNQATVTRFERDDFSKNAFYSFLGEWKYDKKKWKENSAEADEFFE